MPRAGKCVHYNGTVNDRCLAGVDYKELAGPGDGWANRLPCFNPGYRDVLGLRQRPVVEQVACDKRQEPDPAEVEACEKMLNDRMDRMGKIRDAIISHLGGPWKKQTPGTNGSIPCPCCGGTVRFSRSGDNGHIYVKCSTEACAAWME